MYFLYRSAAIRSPWGYIEIQKISMSQKFLDKKIIILSHTYFLSFDITPWATNRGTTVLVTVGAEHFSQKRMQA